jgi:prepilin-type N-terminal cleavage/methylation domain-containing protein
MILTCISNRRGLTLIENMIAMLIFTVVLLAVASMQVRSMKINTKARRQLRHSVAVAETLEAILALPFDDPLLRDVDDGYSPASADHGPFEVASSSATIEWEVDDRFPVTDAKRVSITIRTTGDSGRRKVFTYDYIKIKGFV